MLRAMVHRERRRLLLLWWPPLRQGVFVGMVHPIFASQDGWLLEVLTHWALVPDRWRRDITVMVMRGVEVRLKTVVHIMRIEPPWNLSWCRAPWENRRSGSIAVDDVA